MSRNKHRVAITLEMNSHYNPGVFSQVIHQWIDNLPGRSAGLVLDGAIVRLETSVEPEVQKTLWNGTEWLNESA